MKKDFKFLQGHPKTLCCFCGVELTDGGNNPDIAITNSLTDRCCDGCNLERVVPNRIFVNRIEQFKQEHNIL